MQGQLNVQGPTVIHSNPCLGFVNPCLGFVNLCLSVRRTQYSACSLGHCFLYYLLSKGGSGVYIQIHFVKN